MAVQGGETLASAMFGGALRSEVRAQGARASATIQPFTHLQLDIFPERVQSVADAFGFLTSAERLDGVHCQRLSIAALLHDRLVPRCHVAPQPCVGLCCEGRRVSLACLGLKHDRGVSGCSHR